MAYFTPKGFALVNGQWERVQDESEFADILTPENAQRYAETTDKLCLCSDLTGYGVDSSIPARFEDQLEALAIELGFMVAR
jgi:hypothetical protein